MCFAHGTKSYDLTRCQAKGDDGEWFDTAMTLPDQLEYFSYTWFRYKVEEQEKGVCGFFNRLEGLMSVGPDAED